MSRLLNAGADVECQDGEEGTPLHNAAFNGHIDCVKVLLGAQANLNRYYYYIIFKGNIAKYCFTLVPTAMELARFI